MITKEKDYGKCTSTNEKNYAICLIHSVFLGIIFE